MFCSPDLRGASRRVGAWLPLVAASAWLTLGCSVDQTGLGSMPKLSRDAGFDVVTSTGGHAAGGTTATGGSGSGGAVLGSGGSGMGGMPDSSGGMTGATGGTLGEGGTGGEAAGGSVGAGGDGGGLGGMLGGGGMVGSGGAAGAGGITGSAGRGGTGGTRCTSSNCTGCCAGTVCVTAPNAQQCGARGAACTACGPCQQCSATGQCTIDPSSQWTIVAENAQVTRTPPVGLAWDAARGDVGGAAPDLFCEYENPAGDVTPTTAGVTSTVTDVYSASWNETITPSGVTVSASALMASKPAWRIWVGDEDCSSPSSTTCSSGQTACAYQQPISAATLMTGGLSLSNIQSCVSLNLLFMCASPTPAPALP